MGQDLKVCALFKYVHERSLVYYGKILDMRGKIAEWLELIPVTFPTYTRHSIELSDEIIRQLSNLLFENDDYSKPIVALSSVEAYILIVSAYLHDIGMVVSEKEKVNLLNGEEWRQFISDGQAGAKRWHVIEEFRTGAVPPDECQRNFIADLQTRFLIAELIRRTHHLRTANMLVQHEIGLGLFGFEDPSLKEAISNVCVSHGLSRQDLLDPERFPERRDIRNEKVNVRFLALLLRIGDLLDLSLDRACPLLLNIACSIPSDNLAHWTKYQAITHRLTAPDKIEIHASCRNQDEHRFLQDWCKWLVEEVKEAGNIMSRASRHNEWRPPKAILEGEGQTIKIKPAKEANYIPSAWRFILDESVVFGMLVNDIYYHPLAFVRELVQNALDANRCQLYLELSDSGRNQPDFPTQIDKELREKFPIQITLSATMLKNDLSGSNEEYQVFTIEDFGIGMDKSIIENYLLQVGRSYYTTEDCRRAFKFVPTSRFGIGFLSVFAVSDSVNVETYKPSSPTRDGPIKLTLSGPRNYLLTEKGTRKRPGTRISVLLKKPLRAGLLTESLSKWCKRVEFTIIVNDLGKTTELRAEKVEDFEFKMPIEIEEKKLVMLKSYPIEEYGVEGEIYLLSVIENNQERWDRLWWLKNKFPTIYAAKPSKGLPQSIVCINGIVVSAPYSDNFSYRLDIRKEVQDIPLSRSLHSHFPGTHFQFYNIVNSHLEKALVKHLQTSKIAKSRIGWKYKNRLADNFNKLPLWETLPETIRILDRGKMMQVSLDRIRREETVTLIVDNRYLEDVSSKKYLKEEKQIRRQIINNFAVTYWDAWLLADSFREAIFGNRRCSSIKLIPRGLAMDWVKNWQDVSKESLTDLNLIELKNPYIIGVSLSDVTDRDLFNVENPITKWLLKVKDACEKGTNGLEFSQFERTFDIIKKFIRYTSLDIKDAAQCLRSWQNATDLPPDLRPPFSELKKDMTIAIANRYSEYKTRFKTHRYRVPK